MGTEIQFKMHLPGYYSLSNLDDNNSKISWTLHHDNKIFGNYYDILSKRSARDVESDKEQLRKTILKHESIFRHQLQELHRLYRIQRDMMSEINGSKELCRNLIPVGASQANPFSPGFWSVEEQKKCHLSGSHMFDFNGSKISKSDDHSTQPQLNSLKGKVLQSGCASTHQKIRINNSVSFEHQSKNVHRRLFDLECPPDEFINNDERCQETTVLGAVSHETGEKSTYHGSNNHRHGNAVCSSNDVRENHFLAKLEPKQVEESAALLCFGAQGNTNFSKEVPRSRLNESSRSYAGFQSLAMEGSDEGINFNNMQLEKEKRQSRWISYDFENGQTRNSVTNVCGDACAEDSNKEHKFRPVKTESLIPIPLLPHEKKMETCAKRKIFGIDINENNNSTSATTSHVLDQIRNCSQSTTVCSERFTVSSWNNLSQNLHGISGCSTFGQSDSSSTTLTQGHGVRGGKLLIDCESGNAPSLRSEILQLHPNQLSFDASSEPKKTQCCSPSIGFCNQNGVSHGNPTSKQLHQERSRNSLKSLQCTVEARTSVDLNVAALPMNGFQTDAFSHSDTGFVNGLLKQENPQGALSWSRAVSFGNDISMKERGGPSKMNFDFMQGCSQECDGMSNTKRGLSQHFVNNVEYQSEVGHHPKNKILGFSISDSMQKDLHSCTSSAKPSSPAFALDAANILNHKFVKKDMGPALQTLKFKEKCQMDSLNVEKPLVGKKTEVRHHIDLNLCVDEEGVEETGQPIPSLKGSVRIVAMIDLEELPMPEMEITDASGGESLSSPKEPRSLLQAEKGEPQGPTSVDAAAEALVAISSAGMLKFEENFSGQLVEPSADDALHQLAEIITCYRSDNEDDGGSALAGENGACSEDATPDGFDYFELMTLNIKETKVEEHNFKPQFLESQKNETPVPRRTRRGQARRGRQQKDFQRDVLPNLSSLSRNEVSEDLQMIEGLIRATGGNWQSSLTQKINARGSRKRGRRRLSEASPPTAMTADPLHQVQELKLGLEEKSITGWGKRTRRPPRQRCPASNSLLYS